MIEKLAIYTYTHSPIILAIIIADIIILQDLYKELGK